MRKHAAQLHVNPDRIGIIGFSTGDADTMGTMLYGRVPSKEGSHWPAATPPDISRDLPRQSKEAGERRS